MIVINEIAKETYQAYADYVIANDKEALINDLRIREDGVAVISKMVKSEEELATIEEYPLIGEEVQSELDEKLKADFEAVKAFYDANHPVEEEAEVAEAEAEVE